ncbi:MAG: peptide chain release factor N(5)-glutamine methyltransferase [Methylophilaceae bacterium]|nr:peptide chain release factor N(5)-glutamine methyltransferase [Methylophilaceae bacterium]
MTLSQSIKTILTSASELLKTEDAKLETQLLLQHLLSVNRAWLITHENDPLVANIHEAFEALLNRRLNGEPIAHILGAAEFYGLKLKVTPDTLIPRQDTETLVEAALAIVLQNDSLKILDLGTGTGAIALAIAKHRPLAQITAVDASENALKIAKENAQNLQIANVQFIISDWFSKLKGLKFDIIVSNPPYIEANDPHLAALTFEPISALTSGEDGLDDIRKIIQSVLIYLKPQGWLMLEHGYNQAEKVQDLLAENGLTDITTMKDLGGNERVTLGKNSLIINTHWD